MAYAAVISLKHTIERLRSPTNAQTTESAYEELQSLRSTIKRLDDRSYLSINMSVINALDAEIRDVVWKLEDLVESYFLSQSVLPPSESSLNEMDSILERMKILGEEYNRELDKPFAGEEEEDVVVSPFIHDFGGNKSTTVGLWDQTEKIINELLDGKLGLKTVSLFGMAGIGKTHLATEIYQHPLIVQHFEFRLWVSVGQKDKIRNVLADIVAQIQHEPINRYIKRSMSALKELLHGSLSGRSYLIVLDDMWSAKVYNTLIQWLPASGKERRLILTTRLEEVAKYYCTSIHRMPFLDEEESWNLLWQNVFADKSFPLQLEKAGRKIAENCEGLPLLILTVAKILCGLDKTEEYWKKVADKKTTTFTDAYDIISEVLSPSYEHLPHHLKFCFLYMGVFPQSSKVPLPKLIHLWAVEDFLEPKRIQTLQDFAMECLEKLVSKSVAIVCKRSSNYMIKSSKLHSAYWYLCVKEAMKNKFFHVIKNLTGPSKDYIESQRRLSIQNNVLLGMKEVYHSTAAALTARSLLFTGPDHEYPVPICFDLMLLKVLDALAIRFYEFPTKLVKLLQLRYLTLTHNGKLPSSISDLQQLQCLILRQHHNIKVLRDPTCLPKEIWNLQELRHLRIMGSSLLDPSEGTYLPNLLTLHVNSHSCTEDVFKSIPYVRKLGIKIELQPDAAETLSCFEHISLLGKLESLKCVIVNPRLRSGVVVPPHHLLNLPIHLKKLSLNGLGYSWKCMSAIGSLPSLEILKLRFSAFQGPEWKTVKKRKFQRLKFLLIEGIDLVHWTVGHDCFRRLQRLIIWHCYKLKEIPSQIGDVPNLKTIEVVDCSPSVVASALQIKEDENSSLQVVITSSWSRR
ncbi:hypothetical protein C2S51_007811 [Perilla frutescens var. frutescens]|nr:hypothetical protein C2S51_007811 [Perilla frutescens var. frutescens]